MKRPGNRRLKSPHLDMNPMVDMAFLLVTFFLLATTFKVPEQAYVQLPYATVDVDIPEQRMLTITIEQGGKIYLHLSNRESRPEWIKRMAMSYDLILDDAKINTFSELPGFGMSFEELIPHLGKERTERIKVKPTGIPAESDNNELADWVVLARAVQPGLRVAIKADQETPYRYIDKVIKTLTSNNILRFNLVTEKRDQYE